jgi:glycosyltransferase involved in cell wall biosynthesis
MMVILLNAASHVWVSIPEWETHLRPFLSRKKSIACLPVPSNIPVVDDPDSIAQIRARFVSSNAHLVGHFGAYNEYMTKVMLDLLPLLVNGNGKVAVVLLGKGSQELRDRLIEIHPGLSDSVHATGILTAEDISRHISACDVMLQPYQDGVSGRRTSVMTALEHGIAVVTTIGKATESCWGETGSVTLINPQSIGAMVEAVGHLLGDQIEARRLGAAGRALYGRCFDLQSALKKLLKGVDGVEIPMPSIVKP